MYVCLCRGVTDQAVADAVRDGARSLSAVGRACGAGRTCGGCRPEIRRLLAATRVAEASEGSEGAAQGRLDARWTLGSLT